MSDVVTLLKPLTDKLPWWALVSIAVPVTIGFLVKWYWSSYWSIRNLMVETKLKEDELEERNKKKAETAALKEQKPPLSNVSDYPKFEPVSTKAWFLFTALAIFDFLALVPVSLSEPLTTLKAALIAISILCNIWCLATPFITTLLRTLTHSLEVHVWIASTFYKEHAWIAMEQSGFTLITFGPNEQTA
jgi:hypothetical protein